MESYGTILWVLNLRDGPHRLKNIKDYKEIKDLEDAKRHRIAVFAKSSGSLPHRLSGHRNGSRSRNGFRVWYRPMGLVQAYKVYNPRVIPIAM